MNFTLIQLKYVKYFGIFLKFYTKEYRLRLTLTVSTHSHQKMFNISMAWDGHISGVYILNFKNLSSSKLMIHDDLD